MGAAQTRGGNQSRCPKELVQSRREDLGFGPGKVRIKPATESQSTTRAGRSGGKGDLGRWKALGGLMDSHGGGGAALSWDEATARPGLFWAALSGGVKYREACSHLHVCRGESVTDFVCMYACVCSHTEP